MKRLVTDTPRDNIQTALNLFYIKDHETWVRGGGPAPDYPDETLFAYTRALIRARLPETEVPEDDLEFSAMMAEWLFDDADSMEGIIATLYTAAWAFAELRYHLAAYEDTGLEASEIQAAFTEDSLLKLTAQLLQTTPERLRELVALDRGGIQGKENI